jgi:hypothetical protein
VPLGRQKIKHGGTVNVWHGIHKLLYDGDVALLDIMLINATEKEKQ